MSRTNGLSGHGIKHEQSKANHAENAQPDRPADSLVDKRAGESRRSASSGSRKTRSPTPHQSGQVSRWRPSAQVHQFIIGVGFALAGLTVMLVAGGLAAVGIIAALFVSIKAHEEEKAEQLAEHADSSVVSEATST